MNNKTANKNIAKRQRLAKMLMTSGVSLVVISAFLSAFFIQPTDFKKRFEQQQLRDCLNTQTPAKECEAKFS